MSTTTRVAAWQCQPGPLDVAGNLRRLDQICAQAAAQQVEVLVTPEMFTSGYGLTPEQVLSLAEDAGGPTDAAVAADRAAAPPRDRLRPPRARRRRRRLQRGDAGRPRWRGPRASPQGASVRRRGPAPVRAQPRATDRVRLRRRPGRAPDLLRRRVPGSGAPPRGRRRPDRAGADREHGRLRGGPAGPGPGARVRERLRRGLRQLLRRRRPVRVQRPERGVRARRRSCSPRPAPRASSWSSPTCRASQPEPTWPTAGPTCTARRPRPGGRPGRGRGRDSRA